MDIEDNVIEVKNRSRGKWAAGIQANSPAAPIGEVPEAEVAFPGEDGIPDVQDHPVLVISSGGSMLLGDTVKTATASRSREIFLGLGNTGLSLPQLLRSSRLFEADPSPGLWAAPFSKGALATDILNSWGYPPECRPLEKGRAKGAGWIDGICMNPLLRRSCLYEADPSPGLWPPPFGLKGRRFDGQAKRLLYSGQTWTSYAGCPSLRGNLLTGILNSWGNPPECRPLEKGRGKGAGWIDGICTNPLLRRYRRYAATHPPEGKGITAFSVACGSLQHGYQRLTTI